MYKKEQARTVGRHESFSVVGAGEEAGGDVLPDLWAMGAAG
jgi:hypothetical protein